MTITTEHLAPVTGTATLHFEGEDEPHLREYPLSHMTVEHNGSEHVLMFGDDTGMRVASFPFIESEEQAPGVWRFVGPREDFTLTINPSGGASGDIE